MAHEEMVNKVFEIIRGSMEYNHICDQELRQNIEDAGDTILTWYLENMEE